MSGASLESPAMPSTKPPAKYAEDSIRVLKGLEPVKQRPGMYTRTDSPLHTIQEVIDNAADEALAGFGKRIALTLRLDDEVGAKGAKLSDTKMREYSKASMTSSAPGKPQEQGGALAEALRRAAEKNGRSRA